MSNATISTSFRRWLKSQSLKSKLFADSGMPASFFSGPFHVRVSRFCRGSGRGSLGRLSDRQVHWREHGPHGLRRHPRVEHSGEFGNVHITMMLVVLWIIILHDRRLRKRNDHSVTQFALFDQSCENGRFPVYEITDAFRAALFCLVEVLPRPRWPSDWRRSE